MLASLLLTVALLGGAAAALIWWAGRPLPAHWPSAAQWASFAEHPLTYPTIKSVVAVAGWLLLLLLVFSIGLEAWTRLAHRPPPLILPAPMRVLAAGMLGTSVIALAAPAHAAAPAVATPTTPDLQSARPATGHGPATPPGTPSPPAGADHGGGAAASDLDQPADTSRGVEVPGGWVVWPLAAGILAATAINLLQSRTTPPASALLRAIRAARHPVIDPAADEHPAAGGDDIAALEHDAATTAPHTIGVQHRTAIGIAALPRHGVGITGPGGADALRGILAAAACTTSTVIVTGDLVHSLASLSEPLPGLRTTADLHAALHAVQMEIHHRYTTGTPPTESTADSGHPPLLLIVEPQAPPGRVAALAELGADLNIRIVVAGPWKPGATWSVDRHGHTTCNSENVGRLNILNPAALAQIAHTLQPPTTEPATIPPAAAPSPPPRLAPFHLHVLGRVRLSTPADPDTHIRRSGSRQIAVYLALHPDGATRDELLEHIFGHMTRASAAGSLNSCLYEIRRLLSIDDRSVLTRLDDSYRLDPDMITVDWWQLLHDLQHGHLEHAVASYLGPIADGHTWDWLPEHRQTARHLIADTHARLAHTASSSHQALEHALAGITVDPYSQACYQAAIDAHQHLGHSAQAQTLHAQMVQRLNRTPPRRT
ncbi:hypothetical protein Rhe02_37800 [Rhizocola hellebori]|uniref:Bacterial transcriptional activator domain-containing protein n=2 Tax=Rhizocola hellebori TaxID=1392758 RepID=A0A8J3VHA5_9ACTN|nr:hypothetical protein Rhe02_37800 [Rhizocola hellebori]